MALAAAHFHISSHRVLAMLSQFRHDKRVYLGALKYVPHAVLKLLENMPMCVQHRLPELPARCVQRVTPASYLHAGPPVVRAGRGSKFASARSFTILPGRSPS
jgi:hypothetical protein